MKRNRKSRTTQVVLAAVTAILCARPVGADPEPASVPTKAAVAEPTAEDAKRTSDRFARCSVPDAADAPPGLEILVHAEAPTGAEEAALVRQSTGAARARIAKIAVDAQGLGEDRAKTLTCREIEAPTGDVDYEIEVVFSTDALGEARVSVVDVQARNLTRPVSDDGARCQTNVMGQTSCAQAPYGVAVKTVQGGVVCARGQCVLDRRPTRWHCARAAGGWAELGHSGPECEHGCYSPTAGQCRRY